MDNDSYMVAASGVEDPDTRVFQYLINSGQSQNAFDFAVAHSSWDNNALWLKHAGVALQVLGDIERSDDYLTRSFDLSQDDESRGAALANLAAGRIRNGRDKDDERAHSFARHAVILNPRALAPKVIGAIAAGRLGDAKLIDAWSRHLAVSVPDLIERASFPRFLRDPDMRPFWDSPSARKHILKGLDERSLG